MTPFSERSVDFKIWKSDSMSIARKIEVTANVATIFVAVLISAVAVKTYVFRKGISRSTAAASVPEVDNYQKQGAGGTDVKLAAVQPQPVAEAQRYLIGGRVHVDDIKQISLNTLGVRGAPTLLLVNDVGVVTDVWVGKLQLDQEVQVLTALGQKIAGG